MNVSTKTEISRLDATPEKRLFWSIVSDYDLQTGLCELIDNAIDFWVSSGKSKPLQIKIELDFDRQLIIVEDNAGGVKKDTLRLLVSPGGSGNDPLSEIIGVFGVGSKRAIVALGESIQIKTRFKAGSSYQIDIVKDWIEGDSWDVPLYEIPEISAGTTQVRVSEVRRAFNESDVERIRTVLGEIYAEYICGDCGIVLNQEPIGPSRFDSWAYPPSYPPRRTDFKVQIQGIGEVSVTITAGLITDRNPETENYGVYFYCNSRLITKELRDRSVGYMIPTEAGVPHPDASLARVIVELNGPARSMPWNSSKTQINYDHQLFEQIRPTIVSMSSFYSKLSRRLKNDWDGSVFSYPKGDIEIIPPEKLGKTRKVVFPALPKVRKDKTETLIELNSVTISDKPWTLGMVESIAAVEVLQRQRFDTKNRMALILLDSCFEIALKEFIVNRSDLFPKSQFPNSKISQMFKRRPDVISTVNSKRKLPAPLLKKAEHYYEMRNKLIHERATVGISDSDVENYRETVQTILKSLFGLQFSA